MNVKTFLAAILGMGLFASLASADFIYTLERKASTTAGFDLVQFYILNDGTNGTGVIVIPTPVPDTSDYRIQSVDYTLSTLSAAEVVARGGAAGAPVGPLKIHFGDFSADEDGVNDANITGSLTTTSSFSWVRTNQQPGSAQRLGTAGPTYWETANMAGQTFVKPNYNSSTVGSEPELDSAFQNVKGLRITYSLPGSGVAAGATINGGRGYFLGVAMVPTGVYVRAQGSVAGAVAGSTRNFDVSDVAAIPEPATIGLLGLGLVGLLGRRNRKVA